ncbi:MAG: hypothetical protein ACK48Y_04510 [Planctomyces sp.]
MSALSSAAAPSIPPAARPGQQCAGDVKNLQIGDGGTWLET